MRLCLGDPWRRQIRLVVVGLVLSLFPPNFPSGADEIYSLAPFLSQGSHERQYRW